jgi:hypothetical protein
MMNDAQKCLGIVRVLEKDFEPFGFCPRFAGEPRLVCAVIPARQP